MKIKKLIASVSAAFATASFAAVCAMSAFAEDATQANSSTSSGGSTGSAIISLVLPLAIMFALLYFIAIKPQKKRDREMKEMQDSLQVGDEIVTGGGIVGIVVRTGEDTVVIETGGERQGSQQERRLSGCHEETVISILTCIWYRIHICLIIIILKIIHIHSHIHI